VVPRIRHLARFASTESQLRMLIAWILGSIMHHVSSSGPWLILIDHLAVEPTNGSSAGDLPSEEEG
jgi:hypothetical protein